MRVNVATLKPSQRPSLFILVFLCDPLMDRSQITVASKYGIKLKCWPRHLLQSIDTMNGCGLLTRHFQTLQLFLVSEFEMCE